jgi:predicted Ser/Thr protein kinase/dipeptidyl aminopeptidase/acylaminoacyl peptidase
MLFLSRLGLTEEDRPRTHAREHRVMQPHQRAQTMLTSGSQPVAPAPRLAVGEELADRYRVTGFLGRGGMGLVYRVFDRVLGEEVALKWVGRERAGLREEVRLAQRVTHRNVCRTYDLELIDGEYFVKMEYIAGESLADHLAHAGALSIPRAIAIARAIAEGLAAAHARGIVHRDLKPGNVMLAGDRVVLMDFGLAQPEGASDPSGTLGYMAPEQIAGARVDARTDLFGLGCVMFEMLTCERPFGAGTFAEVVQRMAAPPDIHQRLPGVPRTLAAAIEAFLALDPAARSRGLALIAKRSRRWPLAVVATALVVASAAWAYPRPAPAWEPRIVDLPAYDENADLPALSPDGESIVFATDRGHRDAWTIYISSISGEPHQLSPVDRMCVHGRWMRDGKAVLMSCYAGRERRIVRQPIDGGPSADLGPGLSADDCGDALAVVVARPNGAALVLRTERDTPVIDLPASTMARCTRDGQRIAYLEERRNHPGMGGRLSVVDRLGKVRTLTEQPVESASFTPDGNAIVFAMQRGSTSSLYEIASTGGAIRELTPHELSATAPDISSDGRTLLFDRDRTSMPLFELSAGGAVQRTFRFEELSRVLAAPDGRMLVATKQDNHDPVIIAIDSTEFGERELARGEALFVSTSGDVVFRDNDDRKRLLAIPLAGGPIRTLATLPAPILDAAGGADGVHVELDRNDGEAWLVDANGHAAPEGVAGLVMPAPRGGWRVVRLTTGTAVRLRFIAPGRALDDPAFERNNAAWGQPAWVDDRQLAYCDVDTCRRLDVVSGRDLESTHIVAPDRQPITVSADGKRWFSASPVGHVTRHLIANFAERR